jgi:hypothetical protein
MFNLGNWCSLCQFLQDFLEGKLFFLELFQITLAVSGIDIAKGKSDPVYKLCKYEYFREGPHRKINNIEQLTIMFSLTIWLLLLLFSKPNIFSPQCPSLNLKHNTAEYLECQAFCPVVRIGSTPIPSPASVCCCSPPPPPGSKGGDKLACGRVGMGYPIWTTDPPHT